MQIFLSILLVAQVRADLQLVVVWGKPTTLSTNTIMTTTYDNCLTTFYNTARYVLAWFTASTSTCALFMPNGSLVAQKMNSSSGSRVVFKRNTIDNCPAIASSVPPLFGQTFAEWYFSSVTTSTGYYNITETTKSGVTSWIFRFRNYVECDADSQVLARSNAYICVTARLFPSPYCQSQTDAQTLCKNGSGLSLTGPASLTEGTFMINLANIAFAATPVYVSSTDFSSINIWIDGIRSDGFPSQTYTFSDAQLTDTSGFNWNATALNTDQGPCNYLITRWQSSYVFGASCDSTQSGKSYCFRGARSLSTCPVSSDVPLFGKTSVSESYTSYGSVLNYTISKGNDSFGNTTWNFNFTPLIRCNSTSTKLIRGNNTVCVEVKLFPSTSPCQTQANGGKLCKTGNGLGLTGPYNSAEMEYMIDQTSAAVKPTTQYTSGYYSGGGWISVWLDGIKNGAAYTMTDATLNGVTGYDLSAATAAYYAVGCLFINNNLVETKECDSTIRTSTKPFFCYRGAFCKTQPLYFY
ncbi:unnamed protein product [Caenorhabditis sp. 36 PRJEB53466]|nr:unnamed protein product [Caenorhabditis sp. 36 PRJEB53466]